MEIFRWWEEFAYFSLTHKRSNGIVMVGYDDHKNQNQNNIYINYIGISFYWAIALKDDSKVLFYLLSYYLMFIK